VAKGNYEFNADKSPIGIGKPDDAYASKPSRGQMQVVADPSHLKMTPSHAFSQQPKEGQRHTVADPSPLNRTPVAGGAFSLPMAPNQDAKGLK